MRSKKSRLVLFGVLALALSATVGITVDSAAAKKKVKTFSQQISPSAAIPEAPPAGVSTPLRSTINVGKKYKKQKVSDVNVTGVTTTGSVAGAANDLPAYLIGPTGRTVLLFRNVGDQNLGPWTMDDDTPVSICDDTVGTLCDEPELSLGRPFAGTSNLLYNDDDNNQQAGPLSNFDGTRMKGTWTLFIYDENSGGGQTSTLNSWGLQIKPLKLKPPTVEVE